MPGVELMFGDGDAAEVPGGEEDFVEEGVLGRAVGTEGLEEFFAEETEVVFVAGKDDESFGIEAVTKGIARGAGFAFRGAGSSGKLGIPPVGGGKFFGCHRRLRSDEIGMAWHPCAEVKGRERRRAARLAVSD